MEDKLFNLFNDSQTLITHCPVCSVRYYPLEARIIEEGDSNHLVYIKCQKCQASVLAVITTNSMGISSIGLITDLAADDISKFRQAKSIECDDVIEMHQILSEDKVLIDYLN